MKKFLINLTIGLLIVISSHAVFAAPGSGLPIHSIADLQNIMKGVQEKTTVKIALPSALSKYIDLANSSWYVSYEVDTDYYAVGLDTDPDCDGEAGHCEATVFVGSVKPFDTWEAFWRDTKSNYVKLKDGDDAIFHGGVCGVNCSHAQLEWKHNGFYYMIDDDSMDSDVMKAMADSMKY